MTPLAYPASVTAGGIVVNLPILLPKSVRTSSPCRSAPLTSLYRAVTVVVEGSSVPLWWLLRRRQIACTGIIINGRHLCVRQLLHFGSAVSVSCLWESGPVLLSHRRCLPVW